MQRLLPFAFFLAYIARGHEDVGYELMFEDSKNETNWACWKTQNMPEWLNGSFILPTVGQFSFGGRAFQGTLDGFGKMQRFQFSQGQLCYKSKMMRTGFYNLSHAMGTVAPGMLFDETIPPRVCPKSAPKYPSCNIHAPNDNTFVNVERLGETYTTWTDSTNCDSFDPLSLAVTGALVDPHCIDPP